MGTAQLSTSELVTQIKNAGEDFEWYPTTDAMLSVIKTDLGDDTHETILDVGAGDGRALTYLTKGSRYAIEKSKPLIQAMDRSIYVVGTEFEQQTLIDKSVSVLFSNPPYGNWKEWCTKIIREANCTTVYLIIPQRWRDDIEFAKLLKQRKAEPEILDSLDFLDAERSARAKVDILKINLGYERYRSGNNLKVDPFTLWFDEIFKLEINKSSVSKYDWEKHAKDAQEEAMQNELVDGRDIVMVLEKLYIQELAKLMKNYKAIESLEPSILIELDVNIDGLKSALRQRVEGLKDRYWNELFNNLDKITSRLTVGARQKMLDRLTSHTHVDFTASNCHAVLVWCIKNANTYFDDQLVTLVERMTEEASVVLYKSNERVFKNENWKYCRTPEGLARYSLDYRFILHRVGGLNNSSWEFERKQNNGLSQSAFELLSDIITVANNLSMSTGNSLQIRDHYWESNKAVEISYFDPIKQEYNTLFSVRAFLNGNLHLKLNQRFARKLNVEFGRLKGWLRSAEEAADELEIDMSEAEQSFGSSVQLGGAGLLHLCFDVDR